MTQPAPFNSATDIFWKKAKALFIDEIFKEAQDKNITGSPLALHWRKKLSYQIIC